MVIGWEKSELLCKALSEKDLKPILERVKSDDTLDLEIRKDSINIYYRGGCLLKITSLENKYKYIFNENYGGNPITKSNYSANKIVSLIPEIKFIMDKYLSEHHKEEREFQQLIIRDNNNSSISNSTDYFIIDIENDRRFAEGNARFDMIALKWESTGSIRKSKKVAQLAFIEIKYGDNALKDRAGMVEHFKAFRRIVPNHLEDIKIEMANIFRKKVHMGLIKGLKNNKNAGEIEIIQNSCEYIFLLINHDPASMRLNEVLNSLKTLVSKDKRQNKEIKLKFATSSFMGFGLYGENMFDLNSFQARYKRQILSR